LSATEQPLEVSVTQAQEMIGAGAALIDVREQWEFDQSRIDGAVLIPLQSLPSRLNEIPTDRPVVIQCHHGGRSMKAVQFLRAQGMNNITNLQGGIDRWSLEIDSSIARY